MVVHVTGQQGFVGALSAEDLQSEIQSALAALADIEARYASDRDGLERWLGPESAKKRLSALLEARRQSEREPLVLWLAELHRQLTAPSIFH